MVKVANVEGLVARKTGKNSRTWYFRLAVPLRDQKRASALAWMKVPRLRLSSHSRSSIDNLIQEVLKLRSTPVASSQRFARGNCRQSRSASSSALTS